MSFSVASLILEIPDTILLIDGPGVVAADGATVGLLSFLLFTSLFVYSLGLYKMVFNILLYLNKGYKNTLLLDPPTHL
jgi:hypothetical protein